MKFREIKKINIVYKLLIIIIAQIFISLLYIKQYNYFTLFVYLLIAEYIWMDMMKYFILFNKRFIYLLLFKFLILSYLIFIDSLFVILYIFVVMEILFLYRIYFDNLTHQKEIFCINKNTFLKNNNIRKLITFNWFYIFSIIVFFTMYKTFDLFMSILIVSFIVSIKKEFKFLVIFLIFNIFLYLYDNNLMTIYKDYSISVFSTLTNFAILNIATFFIIIQLNYQKFNSTYVLWKIIKSPATFFAFFPSFILIFSFLFIQDKNKELILGIDSYHLLIVLQLFSILSLFGLLFYTKYFLETNILLKNIFKSIDLKQENNNKYILSDTETYFESILNLIQTTIVKRDYNTAYSLFFNFACWIRLSIDELKYKSTLYQHEKENKFASMFETIILILSKENDIVLQKYFIEAFDSIIFVNINNESFYKYKIIIDKFKTLMLNNLDLKNDEIAIYIYYILYRNTDKILINLPEVKKCSYPIYDQLLKNFEELYIEDIYNIVNIAIKNENIKFLKSFNIIDRVFNIEDKAKWDGKHLNILISLRYDILKQYKFLIEQNEYTNLDFIKVLLPYDFMEDKKFLCYKEMLDYLIDMIFSIYQCKIEKENIDYGDFGLIRGQIDYIIKNNDIEYFRLFFRIYILSIYKICKKNSKKMDNLFKWLINDIKERYLDKEFDKQFIPEEIEKLLKKCNLEFNFIKENSLKFKKSFESFRQVTDTNWFEILDLSKQKD